MNPLNKFLIVFLLLAAGIVAIGIFYYRNYERHFRAEAEQQLAAIADLKVSELARWRQERLGNGGVFFQNPSFSTLVRRYFENPGDADAQRQIHHWLAKGLIVDTERIRLLDTQGVTRLSLPAGVPPISPMIARGVAEALRKGQITFQDFYREESDQRIYLAVLVPLFDETDGIRPLGVLTLRMDPALNLHPFISRWPVPSETAETLLVRREANEAVFLNELRFQTNSTLTLRISLSHTNIPAVKAVLGQEGIVEGRDYRGDPVLAALRAVPDSPWFLVARRNITEVYAPLRTHLWQVIVMISILLFGAGAGVGLVWRQQRIRFYREQAKVAEALRETKDYLESLFNHANAPIIVWDPQFKITRFNHAFEVLTGRSADEILGKSLEILFPPALVENSVALIKKTTGGERWIDVEVPILHQDGSARIVLWNSATVFAGDGKTPVATIAQGHDITARKQAEEKIHLLNAELDQRVRERTTQLQAANKELEAFSYSVSHDLRAPLRHVQGYVEMLMQEAEGRLSDKGRHYMDTIADASREMGVLIDDLLAFSRMGQMEMSEMTVSLNELVQETIQSLEIAARGRNIVWAIPVLPAAQGDPAMIRQVLANLLDNAVKYTRPRDPAQVEMGTAGTEDGRIIFFVRDNGVGFETQYSSKLFGVFQRLHRADEFEGTGIGLANVRRIISRHGGRTWAEGAVDKGATFYFTLKPSTTTNPTN